MTLPSGHHSRSARVVRGEVAGVAGSLPYLSDKRMSVMIYLVGRPAVGVDTSLGLVLTLSGADKASPVVQRVEGDKGVAVWDETTGDVHHVLVGYVVRVQGSGYQCLLP